MPIKRTPDMFEGVFDNRTTDCREVWKDGRLCRYARKYSVGMSNDLWPVLDAAWGTYPDHPSNAAKRVEQPA